MKYWIFIIFLAVTILVLYAPNLGSGKMIRYDVIDTVYSDSATAEYWKKKSDSINKTNY